MDFKSFLNFNLLGHKAISGCILYWVSSRSTGHLRFTMGGVLPALSWSMWQPPVRKEWSLPKSDCW